MPTIGSPSDKRVVARESRSINPSGEVILGKRANIRTLKIIRNLTVKPISPTRDKGATPPDLVRDLRALQRSHWAIRSAKTLPPRIPVESGTGPRRGGERGRAIDLGRPYKSNRTTYGEPNP